MAESQLADAVAALQAAREPTRLVHHGARCCELARVWLECLDSSLHRGRTREAPPSWVMQRWPSGAARNALHWCEIPDAEVLADGAAVALCRELWGLRAEGIRTAQLVFRPATITDIECREAIAREQAGRIEVWDALDGAWLRPDGRTLSLRVGGPQATILRWGDRAVTAGTWAEIELDSTAAAPRVRP